MPLVTATRRTQRANVPHILLDSPFTYSDIKLEQFAANTLGSPEPILLRHLFDQFQSLWRYSRFGRSGFRFVSPKQTKPLSMPPRDPSLVGRIFCHEFGLAPGKVMYRSQHERSERRFCPVSEVLLKQLKTHSRQSLYRVENMIHSFSFPFVKLSR
jgi:hypothetical protein